MRGLADLITITEDKNMATNQIREPGYFIGLCGPGEGRQ
jgi:hypothetical protein